MLKIRLKRIGKKNHPLYRIVVTEHSKSVFGKYIEKLGNYNPFTKELTLNKEKTLEWLNKGVRPSNTVAKLLEKLGIKHKLIIIKKFKPSAKKSEKKSVKPPTKPAVKTSELENREENNQVDDNADDQAKAEDKIENKTEDKVDKKIDEKTTKEVKDEIKKEEKIKKTTEKK